EGPHAAGGEGRVSGAEAIEDEVAEGAGGVEPGVEEDTAEEGAVQTLHRGLGEVGSLQVLAGWRRVLAAADVLQVLPGVLGEQEGAEGVRRADGRGEQRPGEVDRAAARVGDAFEAAADAGEGAGVEGAEAEGLKVQGLGGLLVAGQEDLE